MHLKLRRKTSPPLLSSAANGFPSPSKSPRFNALYQPDIRRHDSAILAADVHLSRMENCSENLVVQKKVLIVDDSPSQVRLMQGLLEPEGYDPIGLNDPRRIEELITREGPNVILLDVVMPERNGFQVCRELKNNAKFNGIPVILVTSKDSPSDRYWGEQQGADGYITKPFTREELLRAVRRFV
jgi:twitching motility two-component system response regulator PilH